VLKVRIKIDSPRVKQPNGGLRDFLCARGFKSTKGRGIILKELERRGEHFNAENLHQSLSQKELRVSKPTIYRTLKLFEKLRLIERFDVKKNCFYYEPLLYRGEHGHLVCEECGKIVDFSIKDFDALRSSISHDKGFTLGYLSIRAFGLCESCLQAMKAPAAIVKGGRRCRGGKDLS
jgi:Fur family transcriptional regulator, ferric uptake regulator